MKKLLLSALLAAAPAYASGPPIVEPPRKTDSFAQLFEAYRQTQKRQNEVAAQQNLDRAVDNMIYNKQWQNHLQSPYLFAPPPARIQIEHTHRDETFGGVLDKALADALKPR